jgi:hypothetical protein
MKHLRLLPIMLMLLCASCADDDFVAPSFLHIDAIKLVPPESNPITLDEGFYTSDIMACYVAIHYPGRHSMDTIGLFRLPFTVPIRHDGPIDYIEVYPAVAHSGNSSLMPFYSFYKPITIKKHTFTMGGDVYSDTLFCRSGDTLRFDTLSTTYNISLSDIHMYELFEPTASSLYFDSVTWVKHDPENACTGQGYAMVHVADTVDNRPFSINSDFYIFDATRALYMELDTRSDLPFEVYMTAAYTSGGNPVTERVMVVNPTDHWQHIYINLGRTWSWFNHPQSFRLSFAALNVYGDEGDVRIDNVKVISTNTVN